MTQQTAATLKDAASISVGAEGTATSGAAATLEATFGLSEIAMVVSIMTGLATFVFILSMVWLNIKKGKRIDRTILDSKGDTKTGLPQRLSCPFL